MVSKKKIKKKAFFLDRDGVINEEISYITKWPDIRIIKDTIKALKKISENDYLIIIVTNQSAIARGITSRNNILHLNKKLINFFKKKKIIISKIYFCPHHPKFNKKCLCRKPGNEMIEKAIKKFNIDISESWLVGDKTSDIKAGKKSKLKTILVKTGYGGQDNQFKVKADYVFKDLYSATKKLLRV